tara:strand:- start:1831 stop:2004 length:174 start_codon:yes stop_codon:yes gene_type:complete
MRNKHFSKRSSKKNKDKKVELNKKYSNSISPDVKSFLDEIAQLACKEIIAGIDNKPK